jgi:hypothetical protein
VRVWLPHRAGEPPSPDVTCATSRRDAEPQYHQKVNNKLGPYSVGYGLSKRKQLELPNAYTKQHGPTKAQAVREFNGQRTPCRDGGGSRLIQSKCRDHAPVVKSDERADSGLPD